MAKFPLFHVDAFTHEKFSGNSAGVVLDAEGLNPSQMQKLAAELRHSETCFVMKPTAEDHDLQVRFFSPQNEIAMCGHNTIALHYVRTSLGLSKAGRVIQKTKAGLIPVEIIQKQDQSYEIEMSFERPSVQPLADQKRLQRLISALGLTSKDLDLRLPVQLMSLGGGQKCLIGLSSKSALHSLLPSMTELKNLGEELGCRGFYCFTLEDSNSQLTATHGRHFGPQVGVPEDPVTGTAIAMLGAYLVQNQISRLSDDGSFSFRAYQGEAMGRAGFANVRVEMNQIKVSGTAVIVFQTEIEI